MNTDKFSVLIKYKYLDYIHEANLSKTDSWNLIEAIIEYDRSEKEPEFENPILIGLFTVIKIDLNENKKKWAETIEKRREAGKKGAEQKKQMSAKEANADFACDIKKIQANQATKAVYDLDLDLDLGYVNEFDGGGNNKPPPLNFETLKTQASRTGFFIDDDLAAEILSCTDPSWVEEPYSFISFVAIKIRENKKYSEKPIDEQRRIFRKLLLAAQNYREEFPSWKKKQEEAEARENEKRALHDAKENKPSQCPKCGTELGENLYCKSCGGLFSFEDTAMKYVFYERQEIDITAGFQNELKRRRAIG